MACKSLPTFDDAGINYHTGAGLVRLSTTPAQETVSQFKNRLISDRHAGLDPASRNETLLKRAGFRIKSGMTNERGDMMAIIEKFLGQRVEIPEDRKYYPKQGLWVKPENDSLILGFTKPTLILAGGVNDLDWLVSENVSVKQGQDVVFVITGKILYIDTPLQGIISFNPNVKQNLSLATEDPYEKGWLFKIKSDAGMEEENPTAMDVQGYIESLKGSEGFKNPEGLKGGVSGICKAVYSGIREQKF
jgi:glycine cleavage system H lipoate-binding protein